MSTWGIGDKHDTDEVFALKKQLLEKDAHNETLRSQLSKKDSERAEITATLNETIDKLRHEADRAIQLDAAVQRYTEELMNERTTRQNSDAALAALQQKLKTSEQTARELQATADMLSSHADSSSSDKARIEHDNSDLRARLRELQKDIDTRQQREEALLRQSQSATMNTARGRPRASSLTNFRVTALEQETSDLRLKNTQQTSEINTLQDHLARTQTKLLQVENEKIAMERRMQKQLQEVRVTLEEREEELKAFSGAGGQDAAEREMRLLERLEEEEARVAALEAQLERVTVTHKRDLVMVTNELNRSMRLLEGEKEKTKENDVRLLELVSQKEGALDERDGSERTIQDLQTQVRSLENQLAASTQGRTSARSGSPNDDPETVATIQRLLSAIDRIRGDRDALRRDLEFVKAETRFAIEDLQAKLAVAEAAVVSAASAGVTDGASERELLYLRAIRQALERRLAHSERAATALALVTQHMETQRIGDLTEVESLLAALATANSQLQDAYERLRRAEALDVQAHHLQTQLAAGRQELEAASSHASLLESTVERLEGDITRERNAHEETGNSLARAEMRLADVTHALTNAEAQRDALALQLTHAQQDLQSTQQELADADARYGQQLCAMSSGEATRALRNQIETLEQRVLRRTEQIGVHQHDIKRMETNLRLQEDRVAEMTAELEVALSQKEAMVEDCRTTREERDEARLRCEEVEESMEEMEESRSREVDALVGVIVSTVAKQRQVAGEMRSFLARHAEQEARLKEKILLVEIERERAAGEMVHVRMERDHAISLLDEKSSALQSLQQERDIMANAASQATLALEEKTLAFQTLKGERDAAATAATLLLEQQALVLRSVQHERHVSAQEATQAIVALAQLHKQWQQRCRALQDMEDQKTVIEEQLLSLESELEGKVDETSSLHGQVHSMHERHADGQTNDAARLADLQAKFESDLKVLKVANAEMEIQHQQDVEALEKVNKELQSYLADSTTLSQAEAALRDKLEQLQATHSDELSSLQCCFDKVYAELQDAQRAHHDATTVHALALDELTRSKEQLENQLAHATSKLSSIGRTSDELTEVEERHQGELAALQAQFDGALNDLDQITKAHVELKTQHQAVAERLEKYLLETERLEAELMQSQTSHDGELKGLQAQLNLASQKLQEIEIAHSQLQSRQNELLQELSSAKDELRRHLESSSEEVQRLQAELQAELDAHSADKKLHASELQAAQDIQTSTDATHEELQKAISAARTELEQAEASLKALQVEKDSLQCDMTGLEADIQRSKSLQRYLESQVKDSESQVASLTKELEQAVADRTQAEKACRAAEVGLSMQVIQSEQTISGLRRELGTLRTASSKFEETIADLKEQNSEQEELLRSKCLEIEANDDRYLEALKENKKLTGRVEKLARRVQSFKNEAASTNTAGESSASMPTAPASVPAPAPASAPVSTAARQRTTSKPVLPVPPAAAVHTSATKPSRVISEPSAQTRPKTPDRRASQAAPQAAAIHPRTPEARRTPSLPQPQPETSSSTAGKKRRAPDDFDDCESVPRQGFTAASVPSTENTTPRIRRSVRTGFTPVRSRSQSASGRAPASPSRRATTVGSSSSTAATTAATSVPTTAPTIADVTNSPRGSRGDPEKAARRGWLGKIRNVPSQAAKGASSQGPLFGAREGGQR